MQDLYFLLMTQTGNVRICHSVYALDFLSFSLRTSLDVIFDNIYLRFKPLRLIKLVGNRHVPLLALEIVTVLMAMLNAMFIV